MGEVRKAIGYGHLQGTFIATSVSKELVEITNDMLTLYPFMRELVTSGSYSFDEYDAKLGKLVTRHKKVNLLNSAERYYVCNTILTKLEDINIRLQNYAWQIRTMRWRDFFYGLDPEGWCRIMTGYIAADYVISEWRSEMKRF